MSAGASAYPLEVAPNQGRQEFTSRASTVHGGSTAAARGAEKPANSNAADMRTAPRDDLRNDMTKTPKKYCPGSESRRSLWDCL